ncbi:GPI anchored cell wall protein [Teratosphaeria destructans]|uniref:GPI anchored cell wall protein n=1 Tax=Teratosphaeria destructans TaxID=418781 RepID=A0A9W7SVG1_9PEZI|nr:GPI anchored cell wall protein [Teratosphaeria destructans]
MRPSLALAAFALSGVSAAILPRQQPPYCCFQITASGGLSGPFTQLGDGQNRLNDTGTPAQFCFNNGRIKDSSGRGCIITPEASQFQCDLNRPASPGFSITSSGQLLHNGSSTFYGCPATDTTYNIYNVPVPDQLKCRSISLSISGNCTGTGTGPTAYGTAPNIAPTDSAAAAASSFAQSADIYYGSTYITPVETAPAAPQSSAAGSGPAPYPVPGNSAPAGGQSGPNGNGPAPYVAPTESAPNAQPTSGTENGNVPSAAPSESLSAAQSIPTEYNSAPTAAQSGSSPEGAQPTPAGYGSGPSGAPSGYRPEGAQSAPTGVGSVPSTAPGESVSAAQSIPTEAPSGSVAATQSIPTEAPSGSVAATQSTPTGPGQTQPGPSSYGSSPPVAPNESTLATQATAPGPGTPAVPPTYTQTSGTAPTLPSSVAPESTSFAGFGPFGHGTQPAGESTTPGPESTQPIPQSPPAAATTAPGAGCEQQTVTVTVTQSADCRAGAYGAAIASILGEAPSVLAAGRGSETAPAGTGKGIYPTSVMSAGFSAAGAASTTFDSSMFAPTFSASDYSSTPVGTVPVAESSPSAPGQNESGEAGSSPGHGAGTSPAQTTPNEAPGSGAPYSHHTGASQATPTEGFGSGEAPPHGSGGLQTGPNEASGSGAAPTRGTGTSSNNGPACQTSLTGAYQTPHLIVPVSSDYPKTSYGTSYQGIINSTTSTIFNFDIPQSYAGKSCSIIFLFPRHDQLETSAYTFSGSGKLGFSKLSSAASQQTTEDTVPSVADKFDSIAIEPGNSYVVTTESCRAGTTESIELTSEGGLSLDFFEDWNPSSLGLYITSC